MNQCEWCAGAFKQRHRNHRFCATDCKNAAYQSKNGIFRVAQHSDLWRTPLEGLPRRLTKAGYVWVRMSTARWEQEHRMVAAQMLGRPLRGNETVHHLNGDRADNRVENLEVWNKSHGAGQRLDDAVWCPTCGQAVV